MYLLKPIILTTLLCFLIKMLAAQEINHAVDPLTGIDPDLYNGSIYEYFVQSGTKGNQFLFGAEYVQGSARIKGIIYPDIHLNYDIFNQQVLLKGQNSLYSNTIISLSQAWLERFSLGQSNFELIRYPDTTLRIYQVTGEAPVRILTHWRKEQKIEYNYTTPIYVFSNPEKEMYLQIGSRIRRFKNNRSFISIFGKQEQGAISKYIHQNNVNVRKKDSGKILLLLSYCNSLVR